MFRHILPKREWSRDPDLLRRFILTGGVITLTSLDFLGFACPPARPSNSAS